jgi:uncharacterized membrane protein YqjE
METLPETDATLTHAAKRLVWRAMAFGHNRAELIMLELEEEREHAQRMIVLAAIGGALGMLGVILLTALIVVAAAPHYLAALAIMAVVYLGGAMGFLLKVGKINRNWESLPDTRDQLQKDRECLEKRLA